MELGEFLPWVTTAGAGVAAYWLMEEIEALAELAPQMKRRVACVISAALAMGAYLAMIGMGYAVMPAGARGWIEALFAVATGAFGLSQMVHGERRL